MSKDAPTEKTTAEIHAEAGQIMASIPGGTGNPAPALDPMQNGARTLRTADEDAMRLWRMGAPKDVKGDIAAYLVNREVIYLHQFPSGKYLILREAKLSDLMTEDDGE